MPHPLSSTPITAFASMFAQLAATARPGIHLEPASSSHGPEVEAILARKFHKARQEWRYLVRWRGFGPEEDTFEPAEALDGCQELQAFLALEAPPTIARATKEEFSPPEDVGDLGGFRAQKSNRESRSRSSDRWESLPGSILSESAIG